MRIKITPGVHLLDALNEAAVATADAGETVSFIFNEIEHDAMPGESKESAKARAEERIGQKLLTRDEAAVQAKAEMERQQAEYDAAILASGSPTEQDMRTAEVPRPKSETELMEYVKGLVDRPHDYGTCVYAMSMAATAAFYYVSHKLGVTGFQASCADMDILRRTRNLKYGHRIIDYNDLLYPQYWDDERTPIFQALMREPESRERFAGEARKLLDGNGNAATAVKEHWQRLVG